MACHTIIGRLHYYFLIYAIFLQLFLLFGLHNTFFISIHIIHSRFIFIFPSVSIPSSLFFVLRLMNEITIGRALVRKYSKRLHGGFSPSFPLLHFLSLTNISRHAVCFAHDFTSVSYRSITIFLFINTHYLHYSLCFLFASLSVS